MTFHNNIDDIKEYIRLKRGKWRILREKRLKRREELLALGYDKRGIRKDKIFKNLRKEQDALSKLIRHADKRLNRLVSKNNHGI